MRCKEAQSKSSSYLDGDLSDDQSSAVRGHLRQCSGCEELFEQESALLELAANLEPLDPPDRVWEGISRKIAEAEVADSEASVSWRWLKDRNWAYPAVGLVAVAAAAVLFLAKTQSNSEPTSESSTPVAVSSMEPRVFAPSAPQTVAQVRGDAIADADRDYQQTIAELREMLEEDRPSWTEAEALAMDAKLDGFRKAAIAERFAIADAPTVVASRDPIYATYRAEISFLQSALAGELPAVGGQL